MTPIESIAAEMRMLPKEQQDNILLRLVAREKNATMMRQILREKKDRLNLRLIQRGYQPHEV